MLPKTGYLVLMALCLSIANTNAQYKIIPADNYTPQIGATVEMMEYIKGQITESVRDLDQGQVDYLFDDNANSIAAILMHIISTEAYYQVETLEGRTFTEEETALFRPGFDLGSEISDELKGRPVSHYLDLWDEVRIKSLKGLQSKDDEWFASEVEEGINYHWVWFHVLEHGANHMGQIALIKNRLPE